MRVELVTPSRSVPRWAAQMCRSIAVTPGVELHVASIELPREPNASPSALWRAYMAIDAKVFGRKGANALESTGLEGIPEVRAAVAFESIEAALQHLATTMPSVVICTDPRLATVSIAARAEHGAWFIRHGSGAGTPWFYRELDTGDVVCRSELVARFGDGRERVIFRSYTATDECSWHRTCNAALWKAAAFSARAVGGLVSGRMQDAGPAETPGPPSNAPSAVAYARFFLRIAGRVARRRIETHLYREHWELQFRPRRRETLPALEGFHGVPAPPDAFQADPFLAADNGRQYVFFEEFDGGRKLGHISVSVREGDALSAPSKVLERPTHMSYPQVFRHAGTMYMLPENSQARRVALYASRDFPYAWEEQATLLADVAASDATLWHDGARFWLFASITEFGARDGEELSLFFSDALEGPWQAHPRNPIVSDPRRARPAGALFQRDGRLFRPAQDLSRRYGGAVVMNEVTTLTETEYAEMPVHRLDPVGRGVVGIHTYNSNDELEVVDLCRRTFRFRFPRPSARRPRT